MENKPILHWHKNELRIKILHHMKLHKEHAGFLTAKGIQMCAVYLFS